MVMRCARILAALAAIGFSLGAPAAAVAKPAPPTIEQLAAFPKFAQFSVSPDGQHVIALEGRGEERVILVWKSDQLSAAPHVIGSKSMKIQSVEFVKDDVLGVLLWQPVEIRTDRVTKTFVSKFYLTDLKGEKWREPLPEERSRSRAGDLEQELTTPQVLSTLPNDPDHILVVQTSGARSGDVFKVNVRNNRATRIQRSEEGVGGYRADLNGELRSRTRGDIDGTGAFIATEIRDPISNVWSEHFRSYVKERDVNDIIGFSADPNIAYLASNVGRDRIALFEYDIGARQKKGLVFEHAFFDASGVGIWPFQGENFGEVLGLVYDGPRVTVERTSARFKAVEEAVRQALNVRLDPITFVDTATGERRNTTYDVDNYISIADYSRDFKTIVIMVGQTDGPPTYYLLRDGKLSVLSKTWPDLNAAAFGTTSLVYYKSRDGMDIPAFLTKPNAEMCGPGPWRAVVHPHGGPWARDDMEFDASMWVPLMASRCMAVLRPQFRGSLGWGRRLWKAGDQEWGQKMQDDKDDGAKWMVENKVAIPGRIAMFGFSYGGYSAFAAAVRPEGNYKCAIAGAGVANIKNIDRDFYTNPFYRDRQASTIDGLNPIDRADRIQIPLMIYHGDRDQTVPIEQSDDFYAKARGGPQPVEYHRLELYGHGPAWTREIFGNQLRLIDDYFNKGCAGGL